jgi:DNA-binding protein HU-beta
LSEVESAIKKGDKVGIIGFWAFDTIKRKARNAQNPKTGAKVKVPEKTTVRYKAGSNLQGL